MLLYHGEDFKSSSKYNTCKSFFELMHGCGLLQLLVIINYLVLFIEYAYQTLVVYPMLYTCRYHPILLLYSVMLLLHWIVCIHYTLYLYIFNHCNDLALNGSLIGNKHICICISMYPTRRNFGWFRTFIEEAKRTRPRFADWYMYPSLTWSFLETKKFDSQSPPFLCKLCNIIERKIIILLTD